MKTKIPPAMAHLRAAANVMQPDRSAADGWLGVVGKESSSTAGGVVSDSHHGGGRIA